MPSSARPAEPLVSIVVPVFDEEECVEQLARRVAAALDGVARYELIFVDDGSRDETPRLLAGLHDADPAVKAIRFTRSFGHQAALVAGLGHARGDCVISMDGDLQHPPEILPELLEAWRGGFDVVATHRHGRQSSGLGIKDALGRLFFRLLRGLTSVPVVPAGADFRLLDRRVVDALLGLDEHFLFVRGLVPWLGYPTTHVEYDVGLRFAGDTKYDMRAMLRLGLDGIFSFSVLPLRIIALLGLATTALGILYGAYALLAFAAGRVEDTGWTSLMVVILIFGGVQLLSIGIVSEYLGRVYEEVKRRPRYVIESRLGLE